MTSRLGLRSGIAASAIIASTMMAVPADARTAYEFDIAAQDLDSALRAFARETGLQVIFDGKSIKGKRTIGIRQRSAPDAALGTLLKGTGLTYRREGKLYVISPGETRAHLIPAALPVEAQSAAAPAPAPAPPAVTAPVIVVTAQKREESIQDVPIAVTALTDADLDEQKIEGGSELVRAVPNVSFSKTNFASYNFSIRGIGTKALSVTSDPAVAVSFNNTPLIRNRLFEQEYFDVQRVEVLRGPQGTLYGRNATAGVVNMIPNFADPGDLAANAELEVGNYASMRAKGMLNVPLSDTLAVRVAGAWTKRDGYDFNTVTDRRVNGRDLWATRATATWEPSDRFRVTAAWEHFNEDDDRSRTGKQLCHRDPGPTMVGDTDISGLPLTRAALSQGCLPGSLYDDDAFGAPNGLSLPYISTAAGGVFIGRDNDGEIVTLLAPNEDPYAGVVQSRDLRTIATEFDPRFKAKNDVIQLNAEFGLTSDITFYSQTAYTKDFYNSIQDYNRFTSGPVFRDSSALNDFFGNPLPMGGLAPGGYLDDPQLGRSNAILGIDQVRSESEQWYQEFRLQSDFAGPVNFSVGANYLDFKIDEDYYVFNNLFTYLARTAFNSALVGEPPVDCSIDSPDNCAYVDPNPLDQINGDGHNYFRSRNIAKTRSYAAFGEIYADLSDTLKITAGLRYTRDKKTATPINSQLLLAPGFFGGGYVNKGYRISPDIVQKWGRLTGRFVVDWAPRLSFTDDTLIYASYARGYKGGGANPPGIDANPDSLQFIPQPATFKPESVNAFEIGMKNSLAGGKLSLNATAFYYDYTDYQVSQIVDRLALNENFDARSMGVELEFAWRPTRRLRLNGNFGYLDTRIADGEQSIDVMNRTQGNPDWVVVKPYLQLASNCVAPRETVETIINSAFYADVGNPLFALCGSSYAGSFAPGGFYPLLYGGVTYDPAVDGPNQGRGFYADLGGNELPNAPHWTMNLGAQYTLPLGDWEATLRGDYYRQAKSWSRVYNTEIDRLRAWDNTNLSLTVERPADGLTIQLYVKNVFDNTPITDAFINSDDSGLTTNVFTLDPRIVGFSLAKSF